MKILSGLVVALLVGSAAAAQSITGGLGPIAGTYSSSLPTATAGVPGQIQTENDYSLRAALVGAYTTPGATGIPAGVILPYQVATHSGYLLGVTGFVYNGSTRDSTVSIQGAASTGIGTTAVSEAPNTSANAAITPSVQYATTAYAFKASAGNLYGWDLTEGSTAGFFAFLNLTAAPAASAAITPILCVPVPANGYFRAPNSDIPQRFTTGITVVSTSSCTTYTAITPVQMSVNYE